MFCFLSNIAFNVVKHVSLSLSFFILENPFNCYFIFKIYQLIPDFSLFFFLFFLPLFSAYSSSVLHFFRCSSFRFLSFTWWLFWFLICFMLLSCFSFFKFVFLFLEFQNHLCFFFVSKLQCQVSKIMLDLWCFLGFLVNDFVFFNLFIYVFFNLAFIDIFIILSVCCWLSCLLLPYLYCSFLAHHHRPSSPIDKPWFNFVFCSIYDMLLISMTKH